MAWLNCGVEGESNWPEEETAIEFDGHELRLFPPTREHSASIHIELAGISNVEALTLINRFLSLISWCDDAPMINTYGWSGNPVPVRIPLQRQSWSPARVYPFARAALDDPRQRLMVALYREARSTKSLPYSFLSYFKILNVHRNTGDEQSAWINETIPQLNDHQALERVEQLRQLESDVGSFLYSSGRCAVAHAFSDPVVDPDDVAQLRRLSLDLPVMKALAEHLIEHEFGVSRCLYGDPSVGIL